VFVFLHPGLDLLVAPHPQNSKMHQNTRSFQFSILQREVDLILGLKRMPPRLQVLKAYDCGGVLLAHLTQLCRQQLRVLVTSVFMHENDFSNLAATVTQMPK